MISGEVLLLQGAGDGGTYLMLCDRSQKSLLPLEPSLTAAFLPIIPKPGGEAPTEGKQA